MRIPGILATMLATTMALAIGAHPSRASSQPILPTISRPVSQPLPPPLPVVQPFPGHIPATTFQVISVRAKRVSSTHATLRLWQRTAGGPWRAVGAGVAVYVGARGLTARPHEGDRKTPTGTFAMNVVLSRDPRVTRMPSHVLEPGDGWTGAPGKGYDKLGRTGEMWAGRDTWTRLAIHIVTNPHRIQGRGQGIFLHISIHRPTLGCVGVPAKAALATAKWLDPAARPLIVISVHG